MVHIKKKFFFASVYNFFLQFFPNSVYNCILRMDQEG